MDETNVAKYCRPFQNQKHFIVIAMLTFYNEKHNNKFHDHKFKYDKRFMGAVREL